MAVNVRALTFCALFVVLTNLLPAHSSLAGSIPAGPNVQITDTGLSNVDDAVQPDLAVLGNTLYAAWKDDRANQNDSIFFAKSTDNGLTWSANKRLSPLPADDWVDDPVIVVQPNGTILVFWYRFYTSDSNRTNDVRFALSTDGGQTFGVGTISTGPADDADRADPQVALDESTGDVYLMLRRYVQPGDSSGYNFIVRRIDQSGNIAPEVRVNDQLGSGRSLSSYSLYNGPQFSITARNGTVCAAWEDVRSRLAIYGACSTNAGQSFGANVAVSPADSARPRLALAPDGTLYATYTTSADRPTAIALRRSTDRGVSWSAPANVISVDSIAPIRGWDLGVDASGQVLLPWSSAGIGLGGSGSAILSTSVDGGANFAATKLNDGQGRFASVASQSGITLAVGARNGMQTAYVAWSDDRNTNDQIWLARADLDGVPPSAPGALRATSADASVLLSWSPASDQYGIQGYRVYRATAPGGPFTPIAPLLVTGTTYRDVGLDGTPYFYAVAAVDGTGNVGPRSNVVTAVAQVGGPLALRGTIAYQVGGDLRLRDLPGGAERTLVQGRSPQFARSGAQIFYASANGIESRAVAGGASQRFFTNPNLIDFALAADERRFGTLLLSQGPGPIGFPICTVSEPSFGTVSGFSYTDSGDLARGIGLSADGRWLVFTYIGFCNAAAFGNVSPSSFCIVNTGNNQENCIKGAGYEDASFAPGGNALVFTATISGQREVWKAQIAADGGLTDLVQLTNGPANQPASHPSWSSDGSYIIFQRGASPDDSAPQTLYVVRADGAAVRALNISGSEAAWFGGGPGPSSAELPIKLRLPGVRR